MRGFRNRDFLDAFPKGWPKLRLAVRSAGNSEEEEPIFRAEESTS